MTNLGRHWWPAIGLWAIAVTLAAVSDSDDTLRNLSTVVALGAGTWTLGIVMHDSATALVHVVALFSGDVPHQGRHAKNALRLLPPVDPDNDESGGAPVSG